MGTQQGWSVVSIMIMRVTGMNRRLQTLEYILQSTGRFVFTLPHTILYMHLVSECVKLYCTRLECMTPRQAATYSVYNGTQWSGTL